ncbi:cytidylyltransferase domain-containing protein [Selenomonas sp. AE3005]|uniref:cytidylyltransferase domain-containing protein n=1 Tax=Selenomonas sp. AE3005 TaxID=1485543 RepID=UPI000487F217|nr:glycosyltransferase family protein [Selenomonas sp. AE3005]
MVKRLGIIVQAHMGSTRLPNKMLKDLCGKTVIGHVISRLKLVKNADELIIATSALPADDLLVQECQKYDVKVFRGSDSDVLGRFYHAACEYNLTDVARVCADNTFVDWSLIDREIEKYKSVANSVVVPGENVPLGLGCEIFSFSMLEEAFQCGQERYHREHVTPYIYEMHPSKVQVDYPVCYSKYRLTLDTIDDWKLIEKLYKKLYAGADDITIEQINKVMEENPSFIEINSHVHQKEVKE